MLLQILNTLQDIDKGLLFFFNRTTSNTFFDILMPLIRESLIWLPLYLFVILKGFNYFNYKAIIWLLLAIIAIGLADQISSTFFKNYFMRIRPCNNNALKSYIHILVNYRPSSYSFTSSHAANHFTLATYLYLTLKPYFKQYAYLFFLWASLICYAQIYVGVHYPFDVLCGAILGIIIGALFNFIFTKLKAIYFNKI